MSKADKHMGLPNARTRRLTPREPGRPTPKLIGKKSRKDKPFTYKYEARDIRWTRDRNGNYLSSGWLDWRWHRGWSWYESARQRDQAMRAWDMHRKCPDLYRAPVPIELGKDEIPWLR